MTQVSYRATKSSFEITFQGHAGYAESGKDIVCAGVSVLASALLCACRNAEKRGEIRILHSQVQSGLVHVRFEYLKQSSMREITALVLECLHLLSLEYVGYVRVKKEKSNPKSISKHI